MLTKKSIISGASVAIISLFIVACGNSPVVEQVPVEAPVEEIQQVEAFPQTEAVEVEETAAEVETQAVVEQNQPEVLEVEVHTAVEPDQDELIVADSDSETQDATVEEAVVVEVETEQIEVDQAAVAEVVEFSATTGLETFSAYRMNFITDFDGTRNGQPTSGNMDGMFEVTKNPEALHWRMGMNGDVFRDLAILGGKLEMYDLGDTMFIQSPDGSWLGVPTMLVDSMLPAKLDTPEDSIELPLTAALQPGEELINGVTTQRYTFNRDNMDPEQATYNSIEGTVWVAVEGNYVVKYEAVVDGEHNMSAGGIDLIDEGAITMMYEISDINGDFTIATPQGAQAISLTDLLFNN